MTCPNFKVKMIKLHDTKFYCCDELKHYVKAGWSMTMFKFCPYCGSKLR